MFCLLEDPKRMKLSYIQEFIKHMGQSISTQLKAVRIKASSNEQLSRIFIMLQGTKMKPALQL